ncbi:MAG: hypothetical protein ABH808_00140 [Candidatus Kuenenbacteria bacterium]
MFSKNKKIIILIIGIIVILILIIAGFFLLKEKKEIVNPGKEINLIKKEEQKKGEPYFLTNEEKIKAGIDPSLEIKAKKVKGDLGEITVIEFPKK